MGWYYSKSVGLIEREGAGAETEDEAKLVHYQHMLRVLLDEKNKISKQMRTIEKQLSDLEKEFGFLKEKYIEEFI